MSGRLMPEKGVEVAYAMSAAGSASLTWLKAIPVAWRIFMTLTLVIATTVTVTISSYEKLTQIDQLPERFVSDSIRTDSLFAHLLALHDTIEVTVLRRVDDARGFTRELRVELDSLHRKHDELVCVLEALSLDENPDVHCVERRELPQIFRLPGPSRTPP